MRQKKWENIQLTDIEGIISSSDKKRFEIIHNKIRAVYGHSLNNKLEMRKSEPLDILYHGTARRFVNNIKSIGLTRKGRQYVHLSSDKDTAI